MSDTPFEPEVAQIVSDLGQLKAFTDPAQARILRILQKHEATAPQLADLTGESVELVHEHLDALMHAGLVKKIAPPGDVNGEPSYRAGARFYSFKPDPADLKMVSGPVTTALLGVVEQELTSSMATWPAQRMSGQLRRARLSPVRVIEFEERFEALLAEFFGSPEQPADEKDDDPIISLASVLYRYPEED